MHRVSDKTPRAAVRRGSRRRTARPITTLAKDYAAGSLVAKHRHRRGQLVYAASGVMRVTTHRGTWIVPPQRAVWVPGGTLHEIRMEGNVAMRTLYVDRTAGASLGSACQVLTVSPLLRELVLEMVRISGRGRERARLMTRLILGELRHAERAPLHIPIPADPRLKRVCNRVLDRPGSTETLDRLAQDAGASSRTIARLCRLELKMPFVRWRQLVRLAAALGRIAVGESIKRTARDVGYATPSAFTAMFRRAFGVTPSRYLEQLSAHRD